MDTQSTWERLLDTEREYFRLCYVVTTLPDADSSFIQALGNLEMRGTALRALEAASKPLIEKLFTTLFELSLATNDYVGLARNAMLRLDRSSLTKQLETHVYELLSRDGLTWEEYHRVCELLDDARQYELLGTVVEQALKSDDPDILEVGEDYQEKVN